MSIDVERSAIQGVPVSCPRCGGAERRRIAPSYFECLSVIVERELRPPGFPVPFEMVEYRCGHRYQEGPPPASGVLCACGTYAIGRCTDCGRDVCGDHSMLNAGSRLCGPCDAERGHREAVRIAKEEEAARIALQNRPAQDHADRVRQCSSGDLSAGDDRRPVEVDGREIASVLREAGVAPRPYRRPKKGLFGRELSVQGWTYETIDHIGDPDARTSDVEDLLIAVDGASWRYRRTTWGEPVLERTADPSTVHPADTLRKAYWGSNTFFERRSAWSAEEIRAEREREQLGWEERRQQLLSEPDGGAAGR